MTVIVPSYLDRSSGASATRIDALRPAGAAFDRDGVAQFLGPRPVASATCFAEIERRWDPFDAKPVRASAASDLVGTLRSAVEDAIIDASNPVVALSGGVDSIVVALLLGDVLGRAPVAATLVTGLEGYCEREATARAADVLGIELVEVVVDGEDIVDALPAAVRAAEVPMYNLHPVTKWMFAEGIASLGFDRVLTGDGADQVIAHDPGVDYLPVVGAIFASSRADVRWPFLDRDVVEWCQSVQPDPGKAELRSLVENRVGLEFATVPKCPRFTPPLDLCRYVDDSATQRIADDLDIDAPSVLNGRHCDDRTLTRWVTLNLLAASHC